MTAADLKRIEGRIAQLWDDGEVNALTHLSGGNESELLRIFQSIGPDDWILCSHRAHYHYMLAEVARHNYHGREFIGGNIDRVADDLIEAVKAGRSMFMFGPRFIQSAICAGLCTTAVGLAMGIQRKGENRRVHVFVGDGASSQGSMFEAVNMAMGRKLPVHFYIESNNRQCNVSMQDRHEVAFPWPAEYVTRYEYTPTWPHAGTGSRPNLKSQEPPAWLSKP